MSRTGTWFLAVLITLTSVGLAIYGCASQPSPQMQQAMQEASRVMVTTTEQIPGHSYTILGPVRLNPGLPTLSNRMGGQCEDPRYLALVAVEQYGSVDAVVGFRTEKGECTGGLGDSEMCSTTCEGTAVSFQQEGGKQ